MRTFPECGGLKTSYGHASSIISKLNELRKNGGVDCDITLICDGTRFPAHKAILKAASPYFECLLGGQFAESKQSEIDVTGSIGDHEVLDTVLEFIYTGDLLITEDNFRELLDATSLFLLSHPVSLLTRYLQDSLVIDNCLEIYLLAVKYSLNGLLEYCVAIIKSRMHDYFCHGSKMFVVPPEIFVQLCGENVFYQTSKQDRNSLLKGYIENLRDTSADISQETVTKLLEIAVSFEISQSANLSDLFSTWIHVIVQGENNVPTSGNTVTTKEQHVQVAGTHEMLLTKHLGTLQERAVYGLLIRDLKWIKMGYIPTSCTFSDKSLQLGEFVGFASNSMVFAEDEDYDERQDDHRVAIIPFGAKAVSCVTKAPCEYCERRNEIDIQKDAKCPQVYFTAWNELYCLLPKTTVRLRRIMTGYQIWRHVSANNWKCVCELELPDAFCFQRFNVETCQYEREVPYVKCKVIPRDSDVLIVMINDTSVKFLVVIKLFKDASKFKRVHSKVEFHQSIDDPMAQFYEQALVTATPNTLKFQRMWKNGRDEQEKAISEEVYNGRVIELDLSPGKLVRLNQLKHDVSEITFPEAVHEDKDGCYQDHFVGSTIDGRVYQVDPVLPYINRTLSYDTVKKDWLEFPGPPMNDLQENWIQHVPEEVLTQLQNFPPAVFEEGDDPQGGGPMRWSELQYEA